MTDKNVRLKLNSYDDCSWTNKNFFKIMLRTNLHKTTE